MPCKCILSLSDFWKNRPCHFPTLYKRFCCTGTGTYLQQEGVVSFQLPSDADVNAYKAALLWPDESPFPARGSRARLRDSHFHEHSIEKGETKTILKRGSLPRDLVSSSQYFVEWFPFLSFGKISLCRASVEYNYDERENALLLYSYNATQFYPYQPSCKRLTANTRSSPKRSIGSC